MSVPYLAHIPFVLAFLGFVILFIVIQGVARRHE